MLAFTAGSNLDTGQQVAYLLFFLAPFLLQFLCRALLPMDPKIRKTSYDIFVRGSQWHWPPRGKGSRPVPKRLRRRKNPSVRFRIQEERNRAMKYGTYLFPLAASLFKVGCRVECYLRRWRLREIQALNNVREPPVTLQALSSAVDCARAVQFDSDSYPIGVDCHASCCMANSPHLFEDITLTKMGEVEGIKQGLDIRGVGTFKFKIDDYNGKTHEIKVPNTLYVPDLRRCLLSPQHWAQEARDNHQLPRGTQMENDDKNCVLLWGQAKYKKTIPSAPSPTFQSCIRRRPLLPTGHDLRDNESKLLLPGARPSGPGPAPT
jgi:hypothetical protein